MRQLPPNLQQRVAEGDFTGPAKAAARVTICALPDPGLYQVGDNVFMSHVFRITPSYFKELPNVKSVSWDRSIDQPIATCTIELYNTKPLPPGTGPDTGNSFDLLGYYTYNRGETTYSGASWGHTSNEWRATLVPDRIIRTYQGYGADYTALPENDDNLVLTGVWWIDDVIYTADGLITLNCRDAGRLLADQIMFPPVVPLSKYPLKFDPYHSEDWPDYNVSNTVSSSGWYIPPYGDSSVTPYFYAYPGGNVYGHYPWDAFDNNAGTYWLSVGNYAPNASYSKEWVQARIDNKTLSSAKVHVWGGAYKVYLSVAVNGVWQGSARIAYTQANNTGINNGSGIPYLQEGVVGRDGSFQFDFGPYNNVTAVRFTFTSLFDSGHGNPYRYRAGVRTIEVHEINSVTTTTTLDGGTYRAGNYGDYSEIVKKLLAYGGFYWPQNAVMRLTNSNSKVYSFLEGDDVLLAESFENRLERLVQEVHRGRSLDSIRRSVDRLAYGNDTMHFEPLPTAFNQDQPHYPAPIGTGNDETLRNRIIAIFNNRGVDIEIGPEGRVWGDIQIAGVASKVALGAETWDKKPILDGITYVKDILGYTFFIDEQGAAIFRMPNLFTLGNYVTDVNGLNAYRSTSTYITLKDDEAILGLRAQLSSRNIREQIFVGNISGKIGAVSKARVPYAPKLRRIGGWTDQNFGTEAEVQIMADLITLRQLFSYRQSSTRIPANPAIQIDDQIEILERTTGEAYFHYVRGISSSFDVEEGKWIYDLTTSWLGTDPVSSWAFKTTDLALVTRQYLQALGQI